MPLSQLFSHVISCSWSFGVLLWEIWSFGEAPYGWLQPIDMVDHLQIGHRLNKPQYADDALFVSYTQSVKCVFFPPAST